MFYPGDFQPTKKPICGVLSVAMLAGTSFARAERAIKNNLMPWQKRHGGRTYDEQRVKALRELGMDITETIITERITLQRFIKEHCEPGYTYSIATTSHCVTVCDGIVADQYEISPIDVFKGRRCYVRQCVRLN